MPRLIDTGLAPVVIVEHPIFPDDRGVFSELWRADSYEQALGVKFVQDNYSFTHAGTLRGLHFQYERPQGKLVSVLSGQVFDVAVDVRSGSPTWGQWKAVLLGPDGRQFFVPAGFAHGLYALESAVVHYKCTAYYDAALDGALRWDDPTLQIRWPDENPKLSQRDSAAPLLEDLLLHRLCPFKT